MFSLGRVLAISYPSKPLCSLNYGHIDSRIVHVNRQLKWNWGCMASESDSSSLAPSIDSDSADRNAGGFCIIEGPETVQDFAKMELLEIEDNIRSRRNKIFLHMEEVRRLRIQQRIKNTELGMKEEQENELPNFPSFIPFLPPLTSANLKVYYATCFSLIAGIIIFGGLLAPTLELKLGIGGTSYEDFIRSMHLPMQLSQVDPIVASFSGGAVGVISALMVVEVNNVKQQEHKRCKYCLGTGYLACARCSSTGSLVLIEPVSTVNSGDQPLSAPKTERCSNCSGCGKFEEKIVETVEKNPVVVIIGETGSGKSTQLSQILHRNGCTKSGIIGITQPRRVAAVSVARRVAQELGVRLGEEVGYAIRFEDRTSDRTLIKYLTDGVLLRESLSNPELNQYSVIILDEAHERSLNTDILLGLVKRLITMRASNLKILITSATLDGEKVSKFFSNCPILNVPGKLYPVEILYSKERPKSYLDSCLKTAIDIHVKEPEGDILIFMTGQDDIEKLVSKLEDKVRSLEEGSCMDAIILPLHGSLPPEMQVRVFSPPPPNCRRFIVSTNIAETSLTVDGVVYVIDAGYVKQRQYNPSTGMYSLDVVQISKVQANQRAGRAGRTRPGKCYRLYPSMVYHDEFYDVTVPEIQRSSLAGCVLYLKSLDLSDIDILKFDFLDPPSPESLEDALKQLYLIDAIDENGAITSVGRTMAELPLEPSLSRTLIEANEYGCLSQALTVAAMLSAETTLLPGRSNRIEKKRKHTPRELPDGSGLGDHIQLLQIYECWDENDYDVDWCKDNDLQVRGMKFVKDVRKQLSQIMQKMAKGSLDVRANQRGKGRQQDYRNLRKALCVGYANQLAERMIHHNGYRTIGFKPQLVQVHPSSVLRTDEEGMLPNYVVYHELISTSRPYMRSVCAVEMPWVTTILKKLEKLDIQKLSGGFSHIGKGAEETLSEVPKKEVGVAGLSNDRESKIQAARERFLARKVNK